jgi:hypothetical protein
LAEVVEGVTVVQPDGVGLALCVGAVAGVTGRVGEVHQVAHEDALELLLVVVAAG